ncbi:hypothetical protein VE04_05017 [Pseudogymnoascus sp. 24MN13]|nr:hypothetical protein VE04_05017 [Pseudogymnoascus sp. 24MN13]
MAPREAKPNIQRVGQQPSAPKDHGKSSFVVVTKETSRYRERTTTSQECAPKKSRTPPGTNHTWGHKYASSSNFKSERVPFGTSKSWESKAKATARIRKSTKWRTTQFCSKTTANICYKLGYRG